MGYQKNFSIIDDYLDDTDDIHDIPAALYPEDYAIRFGVEMTNRLRKRVKGRQVDRVLYVADKNFRPEYRRPLFKKDSPEKSDSLQNNIMIPKGVVEDLIQVGSLLEK